MCTKGLLFRKRGRYCVHKSFFFSSSNGIIPCSQKNLVADNVDRNFRLSKEYCCNSFFDVPMIVDERCPALHSGLHSSQNHHCQVFAIYVLHSPCLLHTLFTHFPNEKLAQYVVTTNILGFNACLSSKLKKLR